jgi:hypothetical protein
MHSANYTVCGKHYLAALAATVATSFHEPPSMAARGTINMNALKHIHTHKRVALDSMLFMVLMIF